MMTDFIDRNLTEKITLDDLAGLAELSYHFSRKFKAGLEELCGILGDEAIRRRGLPALG